MMGTWIKEGILHYSRRFAKTWAFVAPWKGAWKNKRKFRMAPTLAQNLERVLYVGERVRNKLEK